MEARMGCGCTHCYPPYGEVSLYILLAWHSAALFNISRCFFLQILLVICSLRL